MTEKKLNRVLITGAAGEIGGRLRRTLAGVYPVLRVSDVQPLGEAKTGEEVDRTDITDFEACMRMCEGVDAVIHMGGFAVENTWEVIRDLNIDGAYNVYEAARRQGVRRFIYPTSNHAMGFYRRDQIIGVDRTPLPDSRYGVSKAFGELMGALYAHKYGMEVFCIRIGNVADKPADKRRLSIWFSERDLTQLVRIGLEHPDVRFEIVYGVSGNKRSWYDNANAYRLGYAPQDNAEDHAEAVLAKEPPPADFKAEAYQGGGFVSTERGGDPNKPTPR